MKRIACIFLALMMALSPAVGLLAIPQAAQAFVAYPKLHSGDYVMIVDPDSIYYGFFATVVITDLGGGPGAANEIIRVRFDLGGRAYMARYQLSDAL